MGRFSPLRQDRTPVTAEAINRIQDAIKLALDEDARDITNITNTVTVNGQAVKRPVGEVIFGAGLSIPATSSEAFRVDPAAGTLSWGMLTTDAQFYDIQFQGNTPAGSISLATYNTNTTGWAAIGVSGDTAFADFFTYGSAAAGTVFSFPTANLTYLDASHNLAIGPHDAHEMYFGTNDTLRFMINRYGDNVVGPTGALSSTATAGWLWITGHVGVPTVAPTVSHQASGKYALHWNTTTKGLYVMDAATPTWLSASPGVAQPADQIVYGTGASITSSSTFKFTAGQVRAPLGTAGAPTYSFGTRPTDGMYSYAVDTVAISAGGIAQIVVSPTIISYFATSQVNYDAASIFFYNANTTNQWLFDGGTSSQLYMETTLGAGDTGSNFRFASVAVRAAGNLLKVLNQFDDVLAVTYRGHLSVTPVANTIASSAGLTWDGLKLGASTLTLTGTTGITALAYARIEAPTITQTGAGAVVVTDLDGLLVTAPILGTDVTATRRNALRAVGGARFDISASGSVSVYDGSATMFLGAYFAQTTNSSMALITSTSTTVATLSAATLDGTAASNAFTFQTSTSNSGLKYKGNISAADAGTDHIFDTSATRTAGSLLTVKNNATTVLDVLYDGALSVKALQVSGVALANISPYMEIVGAAHTDLTGTSSFSYFFWDTSQTVNFADAGTIATFKAFDMGTAAPTFTSDTATKTISEAAMLYIPGAPIAGANVTLTNSYALFVDSGLARFDGNGTQIWELPADATAGIDVTIDGRIPIKVGGATKYIRYYND